MPVGTIQVATALASTSASYTLARGAFTWRLTRVELTPQCSPRGEPSNVLRCHPAALAYLQRDADSDHRARVRPRSVPRTHPAARVAHPDEQLLAGAADARDPSGRGALSRVVGRPGDGLGRL